MMKRLDEVLLKHRRVADLLAQKDLDAVVLKKQPNFSWLTGGGLNMVGIASEMGVTSLLITKDCRYVLANRIAAAYWRLKDPAFMDRTEKKMATAIPTLPQPTIPAGETQEQYFNENYEKLGPTPAYIWFQYSMVLKVQSERPLPSLEQTLRQSTFP